MNTDVLNAVLEIVFSNFMVYLSPALFLLMVALFGEKIIDVTYKTIVNRRWS